MIFRLANGAYYENMSEEQGRAAAEIVKSKIPAVGLVYWDYYSEDKEHYNGNLRAHKAISDNVWFAGGCWNWVGYAPLNARSLKTSFPAMRAAKENNIKNIVITVWGDDGGESSRFSVLPSLFYCKKVYDGEIDMGVIKREFKRITGENFDDMMKLDLPNYAYGNDGSVANACKYMLFADPFCGFTDSSVDIECEKVFVEIAKALAKVQSAHYGELFAEESKLCEILALKCTLGIRLRAAYRANDKAELVRLAKRIKLIVKKTEEFYSVLRTRWLKENKPFGWEVQDIRIGGLIMRLKSCGKRLENYLAGGKEIEELSEDVLDYYEDGKCGKRSLTLNCWGWNVSVNRLSF